MALNAEDRVTITDLIALHGHLVDVGELQRLDELFTADVIYDVTDLGGTALEGLDGIRQAAHALGAGNPVAHHVTNIVLTPISDTEVVARSKGIGVNTDGTCGSATYEDTVVRTDSGWRISHRKVHARRVPLNGLWG
ncbi:nuclear transport factor 2 family protein [Embleya sp. NBC_00896]|uniref:nuclear transport factor 2 family protein n=1 Tax=Embleya sp. NBC_00896 TaxID=2975961 RepID=UPI002F91A554|nr:nuclear transport factor 2 family protein [Embleya sp. NBC_00896]